MREPHTAAHVPALSVVIPVYHEGDLIEKALPAIDTHLQQTGISYEMIVVDDGSSDDTWDKLRGLQAQLPHMQARRFSRNFGKESGILAGMQAARGRAVIVMDGDLQHPPELIPQMVQIWQTTDADVVETVRQRQKDESIIRKLGARLFYAALYLLTDYDLSRMSDYKLLDRRVVDAWLELGEYNRFYRGLVAWLGFKHIEITFTVPQRPGGRSSWSVKRLVNFALQAIVSFSSRPLQLITLAGLGFCVFAVLMALRVIQQVLAGTAISGFATVILLQLIVGGIMMLGMGVLGLYIAAMYTEIKRRPHFIIREELGNNAEATPAQDEDASA